MRICKAVMMAVCTCLVAAAHASVATEDQLAEVYSETLMLKAQAKREEARQDLASKAGGLGDGGALPNVRRIDKVNDEPATAELLFAGNVKVEAREGTRLPGGYKVEKVDMSSRTVDISRGRDRYTIGMSMNVPLAAGKTNGPAGAQQTGPTFSPSFVPAVGR